VWGVGVLTGKRHDNSDATQTVRKKFINESGLYSLILGASKQGNNPEIKAKAKKFKRWVTSEVLPSIRKDGGYIQINETDDEVTILARGLLVAERALARKDALILEQERVINAQKPKVRLAEAI
ncbi:BRO family protein, partial [Lysinibacillus capsici]|uniref:BRO-N domain-containing protein n=1 Tax=Lysinibacillus capsici TaxID=2115968 RepID=UPI002448F26A